MTDSKWREEEALLAEAKCPTCDGRGECDDAEPGGISFNTWQCPDCYGTGYKKETS